VRRKTAKRSWEPLHELLRSIQQQGLADLQESYDIDLARSLHRLFGSLQALAIREDLAGKLAEAVVQRSASPQSPSIDELLESYAGLSLGELIDRLLDLLLKWVDDDERRDKVLSELAGIIDAGRRRKSADSSDEGETGVSLRPVTAVEADRRMLDALSSGVTMLIEGAVSRSGGALRYLPNGCRSHKCPGCRGCGTAAVGNHRQAFEVHQYFRSHSRSTHRSRPASASASGLIPDFFPSVIMILRYAEDEAASFAHR
jgi:hypothetical protein